MGGKEQPGQSLALNGIRVTSSEYGNPIPLLFGTSRIAAKMIWYGDFTAKKASNGKKAGGGKKGSSNQSYTYSASVELALCRGGIQQIGRIWDTQGYLATEVFSFSFVVPGGGGDVIVPMPGSGQAYADSGVTQTTSYSVMANDYGSDGPVLLAGNQQTPLKRVAGVPAPGEYSATIVGNNIVYNFNAAQGGMTVTTITVYTNPTASGSQGVPTLIMTLTVFNGINPQSSWSYLTTTHPGEDLAYADLCYLAAANADLGSSGALPNLTYEVYGLLLFGGGIIDAEPSAIANFLLTDSLDGVGFDSSWVGDLTSWFNNNVANGLFLSPCYDSQDSCSKLIDDLCEMTNTAPVWSDGVLKFKPYGDTTLVANGATYVPATSPLYDFTDADFITSSNSEPVQVQRLSVADAFSSIPVEFLNRANNYNVEVAEAKDQNQIEVYGLRKADPAQHHEVMSATVAMLIANFKLKREVYIRSTYKFTVGRQYILTEPMDLVTLTDQNLGFNKLPVRITKITETVAGLAMEAEEFPWGTATATLYPHQAGQGVGNSVVADPGNVNTPIIFEAPDRLSMSGSYEAWIGISGVSPDWGGCSVWMSTDGATYELLGAIHGQANMGVLSANLASHADPDSVDTLSVDLTESLGSLLSGTAADANNFRTLCYVDGEFISYQNAVLTAPNKYNLGTLLRRGAFGSKIAGHLLGSPFLRLDGQVFVVPLDPTLVGTTIFFKFTSINTSQQRQQSLASVSAYPFLVNGFFDNGSPYVGNNATINSVAVGGFARIQIYNGGIGGAVTVFKQDGTTRIIPAALLDGFDFNTIYWITYNFLQGQYNVYTSFAAMQIAVNNSSELPMGPPMTTCDSGGGGGQGSGGGPDGGGGFPILAQ